MLTPLPITLQIADPELASRLRNLAGADAPPMVRWRFTPRAQLRGREVVSTTRLVDLDAARSAWAGAGRVNLWPLTLYHRHLLVGWTREGTASDGLTEVCWHGESWAAVGEW